MGWLSFISDPGDYVSEAFDGVVDSFVGDDAMADSSLFEDAVDLAGQGWDYMKEHPDLMKGVGTGLLAATQYRNQQEQLKQQHKNAIELQNLRNAQQNERHWIKPSGGVPGNYQTSWLNRSKDDDEYEQQLRLS